jgi:hypothetical protein
VIPALALGLYLTGLVLAFGWRSIVQWRRTGDAGLRLDAGPPGSVSWWAKLLFIAALVLGAGGPLAAIVGVGPVAILDRPVLAAIGLGVAGAGVLATLAARLRMGNSWRIGVDPSERTALVTGGRTVFAHALPDQPRTADLGEGGHGEQRQRADDRHVRNATTPGRQCGVTRPASISPSVIAAAVSRSNRRCRKRPWQRPGGPRGAGRATTSTRRQRAARPPTRARSAGRSRRRHR